MTILHQVLRVLLILLLLMPVAGGLGVFPPPTADMYPTPEGWAYMSALMATGFMMPTLTILCGVCALLMILNRTALAAALLAPFTVNVMLFHWFLDPTPIGASSSIAYVLLLLNAYFLWVNREKYRPMWS
jgi:hypothetical protein